MAFWKSVVGKLWATILGMVSVVLLILTLLLGQFLGNYYSNQQSEYLANLASQLAELLRQSEDINLSVRTAAHLLEAYQTNLIVERLGQERSFTADPALPRLGMEDLFTEEQIRYVHNAQTVISHTQVPSALSNGEEMLPVLAVSTPLLDEDMQVVGQVTLYQSLQTLTETTNGAKRYILYAAGIAFVMTTFFAFFLIHRVTSPLTQMKRAADQMSQGNFAIRVPIRTNDEIGQLAGTINKLAEELDENIRALYKEKEQLSSILSSMVDGVLTVDNQGTIILTNPPVRRMLNELDASSPKQLPQPLMSIFKRVMEQSREQYADVSSNGRTWSVVMAPLYESQNKPFIRGAVAVLRDVTEERKMDKLRNEFVANVSHELRTPISMMQGYSEAIIDDVAQTVEEKKALAAIIHEESIRMSRLVSDLLDLARMESGHLQLKLEKVDLVELVQRTVHKFKAMADEAGVELIQEVKGKIPLLDSDEDRLEQVFTNLLDNALRYTPRGGKVSVKIERLPSSVKVQVSDTGIGIPADDLPFIFERFYKADKARTRGKAGTGLGLSIVKNIVESHNGIISVKSREGEGTTFTMEFPLPNPGKAVS